MPGICGMRTLSLGVARWPAQARSSVATFRSGAEQSGPARRNAPRSHDAAAPETFPILSLPMDRPHTRPYITPPTTAGAIEMAEERMERRLSAILAADIAGYSALMGADEARTVRDLKGHQAVVLPMVGEFGGRIIDTAGDGILAEFPSVVNAVKCAVAIQSSIAERNAVNEPERRMQFRIGVNIGDVISDEGRIYGDGVNIA